MTLSDADRAALSLHIEGRSEIYGLPACDECRESWPCLTARLAAALSDAEAERDAALRALDFRASVPLEGGFHGGDLLRAVAEYMDKTDDARGGDVDRRVQADLRRWADDVDAALARHRGRRPDGMVPGTVCQVCAAPMPMGVAFHCGEPVVSGYVPVGFDRERRPAEEGGGLEWAPDDVQRRHIIEKHAGSPYECSACQPFIVTQEG